MVIRQVALFGAASARTKSYLQILGMNNLLPNKVYLMCKDFRKLIQEVDTYVPTEEHTEYFNLEEPVLFTLRKYNIPYEFIASEDINDKVCLEYLKKAEEPFLIYSGFGGQILKPHLFQLGKKFIHVHAGQLPQYRGSTTIYYSILNEHFCGASAIFLSSGLDEGEIIAFEKFEIPRPGINIDYVYEPYTRACTLAKALKGYTEKGYFESTGQDVWKSNLYYIIHPVLKHIAILQQGQVGNGAIPDEGGDSETSLREA